MQKPLSPSLSFMTRSYLTYKMLQNFWTRSDRNLPFPPEVDNCTIQTIPASWLVWDIIRSSQHRICYSGLHIVKWWIWGEIWDTAVADKSTLINVQHSGAVVGLIYIIMPFSETCCPLVIYQLSIFTKLGSGQIYILVSRVNTKERTPQISVFLRKIVIQCESLSQMDV